MQRAICCHQRCLAWHRLLRYLLVSNNASSDAAGAPWTHSGTPHPDLPLDAPAVPPMQATPAAEHGGIRVMRNDKGSVVMEFKLPPKDPADIARLLKYAMGSNHKSATLICRLKTGETVVHRWNAGDSPEHMLLAPI